jgi:hypothetical protein
VLDPLRINQELARRQWIERGVNVHRVRIIHLHLVHPIVVAQVPLQPLDPEPVAATTLGNGIVVFNQSHLIIQDLTIQKAYRAIYLGASWHSAKTCSPVSDRDYIQVHH